MGTITKEGIKRLHDRLNGGLFDGDLSKAFIPQIGKAHSSNEVEITTGFTGRNKLAVYETVYYGEELCSAEIRFNYSFLREIENIADEEIKTGIIASVLLHEMIHQHLTEKGVKLAKHNIHGKQFIQDGLQHGYQYLLGACINDGIASNLPEQKFRHEYYDLLPVAEKVIQSFKF